MKKLIIYSYGKINLGLDIISKRADGYHNISSIMQRVDLRDKLTIEESNEFQIICDYEGYPNTEDDLVYKAYKKLKDLAGLEGQVKIHIEKNIPIGAGLAGGSGNAAATLVGLNELWDLGYSEEELMEIGRSLGADVPYSIKGGTVHATGIGEVFTELREFSGVDILLVYPNISISTENVYKSIDEKNMNKIDMDKIRDDIEKKDFTSLRSSMKNIMEEPVLKENPILVEIKEDIVKLGGELALMSGSGSTIFGIFTETIDKAYESIREKYPEYIVIKSKTI